MSELLDDAVVALEFESDDDQAQAIDLYVQEYPDGYLGTPGRKTIVIPSVRLKWLTQRLDATGLRYVTAPVIAMGKLPPEEQATLRRQRGKPDRPGIQYVGR